MRREVVSQPAHDERGAREDAGGDEEGATVLDRVAVCADEHDVAGDGDGGADEHEGAAHFVAVGCPAGEEDGTGGDKIGGNSEKLGVDSFVAWCTGVSGTCFDGVGQGSGWKLLDLPRPLMMVGRNRE